VLLFLERQCFQGKPNDAMTSMQVNSWLEELSASVRFCSIFWNIEGFFIHYTRRHHKAQTHNAQHRHHGCSNARAQGVWVYVCVFSSTGLWCGVMVSIGGRSGSFFFFSTCKLTYCSCSDWWGSLGEIFSILMESHQCIPEEHHAFS